MGKTRARSVAVVCGLASAVGLSRSAENDFSEKQYDLLPALMRRMERLEARMKLIDEEQRGTFDLSKMYIKPEQPPKSDLDDLL